VFAGAREIEFSGMQIHSIPCTNFEFYSLLTDKDIEKAKKEDDPDADAKPAKREPKTLGGQKKSALEKQFNNELSKVLNEI
jgi:hypothetical protein